MYPYYEDNLSGKRLRRVYEIAPERVQRYLRAEVDHVLNRIRPGNSVMELGCGYGRIVPQLLARSHLVVGIDTSVSSLMLGKSELSGLPNCHLICMNAARTAFEDSIFDCTVCIQNGISAFHTDKVNLLREAIRVTRLGGTVLFSSYSSKFWDDRLEWFRLQSEEGLLGEIDFDKTGDGTIICHDGFTATTVGPDEFLSLTRSLDADVSLAEIDESSVFCEIRPR